MFGPIDNKAVYGGACPFCRKGLSEMEKLDEAESRMARSAAESGMILASAQRVLIISTLAIIPLAGLMWYADGEAEFLIPFFWIACALGAFSLSIIVLHLIIHMISTFIRNTYPWLLVVGIPIALFLLIDWAFI